MQLCARFSARLGSSWRHQQFYCFHVVMAKRQRVDSGISVACGQSRDGCVVESEGDAVGPSGLSFGAANSLGEVVTEAINLEELRAWRSGTDSAGWVHMNAAGASPPSSTVHTAMVAHLELECQIGGYAAAASKVKEGARDAHHALAQLLGCDADEIAISQSAQAAWALAFYSCDFRKGDCIFCFENEYAGNAVAFLQMQRRTGARLEILPMCANGVVDLAALEEGLRANTHGRSLVALTHVQTNSSIIQPAVEVGRIAKAHGAIYLLDACQAIGQLPVDVRAIGCDFASGTGRKWLRGPRGTGFLYARRDVLPESIEASCLVGEPPLLDHVSAQWMKRSAYKLALGAKRYEMWEFSPAAHAGLAAAVDGCHLIGPARISAISNRLARRLRAGLAEIPGLVLCDAPASFEQDVSSKATGASRCAIVLFEAASKLGVTSQEIHQALSEHKIGVSVAPSTHHFNDALWAGPSGVRISPTYFNTDHEIDAVVAVIRETIKQLAHRS